MYITQMKNWKNFLIYSTYSIWTILYGSGAISYGKGFPLLWGKVRMIRNLKGSRMPFVPNHYLKVPKREIFDRSDFPVFYTMKSLRVGDCGVKIKKKFKNIQGFIQGCKVPYAYAQCIFKEVFFLSWGQKFFVFWGAFKTISQS